MAMSWVIRTPTELYCGTFWFGPSFGPLELRQAAMIFANRADADDVLAQIDDPTARVVPLASLPAARWRRLPRRMRLYGAVLPRRR